MNSAARTTSPPLPQGIVLVGSLIIAIHFLALGALVLSARSGPWLTSFGASPAEGPLFAGLVNQVTGRYYLRPLHMTHDYHFAASFPELPTVYFEVVLKNEKGEVLKTVKLPDGGANSWVAHRQRLLAQALGDDQPVQPPQGEQVLPGGQQFRKLLIWDPGEGESVLRLKEVLEVEIPRNRPMSRPSHWSLLLSKSYVRYLCRQHGAASGELIRHSRNPLMPTVLFMPDALPRGTFDELVCNFGKYSP